MALVRPLVVSPATLMLAGFLVDCGIRKPPERPAGVPAEAVWAGGLDGGSFVLCDADSGAPANNCAVYNEDTGQVMDRGSFRLKPENRPARKDELRYAWADWGGQIGLSNGRTLARLNPHSR
jgi:hypothetical protein